MTIQKQQIQPAPAELKYISYKSYQNFTFNHLYDGAKHRSEDSFITPKGIQFKDYVGCMFVTGNELFYYPELAKKVRELKEYPTIHRHYTLADDTTGLAIIENFYQGVIKAFDSYMADKSLASSHFDHLILAYGCDRVTPVINALDISNKKIVISGVKWSFLPCYDENQPITQVIDLYRLVNLSRCDFSCITPEEALLGTPFIAFRIAKTWKHTGHVSWYNLNTLAKVSKADITKWQNQHN